MKKKLKIAHLGLKGIPARFGGIEIFVEEISKELVSRNHAVTVYCREWYSENKVDNFQGVQIKYTPTINIRIIDSFIHGFTTIIDIIRENYDIVHFHGYLSYIYIPFLRLIKKNVTIVTTYHGQLWLYDKYNRFQKLIISFFAKYVALESSQYITSVSPDIIDMFKNKKEIYFTPIGMPAIQPTRYDRITKLNLKQKKFLLFLGVLEKNKRVDWVINAYKKLSTDLKCVIAGDTPDIQYKSFLYQLAKDNDNIIFTGFVTGHLKEELLANCKFFLLLSDIEGMPVAITEAVGYARPCIIRDNISFRVLFRDGETGYFIKNEKDLYKLLVELIDKPHEQIEQVGLNAQREFMEKYSYKKTVDTFEKLYLKSNCNYEC